MTPTHYVIVDNGTSFDASKYQKLTYKLTHMYFNWPGTVRVPAPCQYAHKLAYLVGEHVNSEPAKEMEKVLYYL